MTTPAPLLDPRPLPFRTTIAELGTPVVVECVGPEPLRVLEFDQRGQHSTRIRVTSMGKADPVFFDSIPLGMELGDFAGRNLTEKPLRAFSLPAGHLSTRHNLRMGLARAGTTLVSLATIPVILLFVSVDTWKAFLIALVVTIALAAIAVHPRGLRRARHVYRTSGGEWRMSELLEERPALVAAVAAVNGIKEEYGRLLTDVIERIEHPALFDPAVETTRRFTSALLQWDESSTDLDAAEKSTLSAQVRLTFRAAREHADAVGMSHLPPDAREPAARAVKSLRLAESTTNVHEREAALRVAVGILESLMIYYLPRAGQVRAMVEGRPLLALPGRLTERNTP